ncbi:MAG: sigma-70 family RNA polymerase sigma factor [Planctomycetes bacterium]|nr:sigma-70 family RNA polymerase sigma factor [Planctomycetota bacterium]
MTDPKPSPPPPGTFTTRWSRIERLHDASADEAWRWFIDRYSPAIRAMLRRRLPAAAAAHAESEFWGYLYVSRAVANADRERRFRPYLAGVVRNFARAWWRRHAAAGQAAESAPVLASAGIDWEQEELRAWARHTLMLALEAMATDFPTQATVLRWFYGLPDQDGAGSALPVGEIAARLGKSIAAIHQDLTRGRLRLRSCLEAELREQSGTVADWRAEILLIVQSLASDRPGLIPS